MIFVMEIDLIKRAETRLPPPSCLVWYLVLVPTYEIRMIDLACAKCVSRIVTVSKPPWDFHGGSAGFSLE